MCQDSFDQRYPCRTCGGRRGRIWSYYKFRNRCYCYGYRFQWKKGQSRWDLDSIQSILPRIYDNDEVSIPRRIADLARVVREEAEYQDIVAQDILERASQKLIEDARTVLDNLSINTEPFPIAMVGGVIDHVLLPDQVQRMRNEISDELFQAQFVNPKFPLEYGSVLLGLN